MQAAFDQFRENIVRARNLIGLNRSLESLTTVAVDLSDLLRASLVLSVSALDCFVHDFVRTGMLEINQGNRPVTDTFLSFRVPMSAVRSAMTNVKQDEWLNQTILQANGWLSFQHPDKIADAIRLISDVRLWVEVASELGTQSSLVRSELLAIVDRRNKIAHEADMDPTNPGHRWPIDDIIVGHAIDFIERVARSIFNKVA